MVLDLGIGVIVSIVSVIGVFSVMRYMLSECRVKQGAMDKRLERHGDDIVALNTKAELAITARYVDDHFVSKELFRQFEKHIDKRFDGLEEGQHNILQYIKQTKGRDG